MIERREKIALFCIYFASICGGPPRKMNKKVFYSTLLNEKGLYNIIIYSFVNLYILNFLSLSLSPSLSQSLSLSLSSHLSLSPSPWGQFEIPCCNIHLVSTAKSDPFPKLGNHTIKYIILNNFLIQNHIVQGV